MSLSDEKIRELLSKPQGLAKNAETRHNFRDLSSLNELWIAWAAGFIDGEGAVLIKRYAPCHGQPDGKITVMLDVNQKVPEPLFKLEEMFGGKVGYTESRNIYYWRIFGQASTRCLRVIRPYLLVKGEQADLAIECQEVCFGTGVPFSVKLEYYERIKQLRRK